MSRAWPILIDRRQRTSGSSWPRRPLPGFYFRSAKADRPDATILDDLEVDPSHLKRPRFSDRGSRAARTPVILIRPRLYRSTPVVRLSKAASLREDRGCLSIAMIETPTPQPASTLRSVEGSAFAGCSLPRHLEYQKPRRFYRSWTRVQWQAAWRMKAVFPGICD
jgi:hypothetical protein